MKVHKLFTVEQFDDILRNIVSIPDETTLEYTWTDSDGNNQCVVDVTGDGVNQQYVLIKVSNFLKTGLGQTTKELSVLQPVFIIEDSQNVTYGAFKKERIDNFVSLQQNNLKQLKAVLKTLAEFQATMLATNSDKEGHSEYLLKDITENTISLDYFKSIETVKIIETIGALQVAFNKILNSNLLVESIWSSDSNVYVSKDDTGALFLKISSQKLLPPAYDALSFIFSLSNEKFRQKYFEELTAYYFKALVKGLDEQSSKVSGKITRMYAEVQLRTLLPIVKFKVVENLNESIQLEELLANISNYLKYPLLHQEDVYQITKNKLLSDDYELLSFKLVPLSQANGHLGEYFHLDISVKFQNKEEHHKLFAKFLLAAVEGLRELLENGAGKKEDFFYNMLYPLYENHGLEDLLGFAPKCYLSKLSGFLVLEDLGNLGYTSLKPNSVLNYDALKIILEQLAKFHASTLIVEEKLSKQSGTKIRLDDEHAEYFVEMLLKYEGNLRIWYDRSVNYLYYTVNKFPDLTQNLDLSVEELQKKLKDILFSTFSKVKKSETVRNVVNHGDMYVSNLLLKFGKDNSAEDGVLIDFQLLRYLPPAYEILFFIYISSTKDTRNKYMQILLDHYYEKLSSHLKYFNLDPEDVFSRKQFDDNINYMKSASIATAFNYSHIIHTDPDFREEILHDDEKNKYYFEDNIDEFMDISWQKEHFRLILKGLAEDLIDLVKNDV